MTKLDITAEPGKQGLSMTRVFDAPPSLVFKAYTDPEIIPQWMGPRNLTTTIDRMEVKHGGAWRFVQRDPNGNEFAFRGVFHEVKSPERIIQTFEFEGMPGHVLLETVVFEDQNGKTKVTANSVFQSVEDRDGMMQSGMEDGAAESWDRLAEVVAKL